MNWVHYVNDPPDTTWGRMRARNGHPEPYGVRSFQIDNEPMNNGFTAERYAAIVNLYGSRLRQIAPDAVIVACGQKRSNDMAWSEKVIDLGGQQLRRPRRAQLRVRERSLRVRCAAHRRLSTEAARLRARVGAPGHPPCGARVEPEPDLRLARRSARRRQPDPVRVAHAGIDDDGAGAADAEHGRTTRRGRRSSITTTSPGFPAADTWSKSCSASTSRKRISRRPLAPSETSATAPASSPTSRR